MDYEVEKQLAEVTRGHGKTFPSLLLSKSMTDI